MCNTNFWNTLFKIGNTTCSPMYSKNSIFEFSLNQILHSNNIIDLYTESHFFVCFLFPQRVSVKKYSMFTLNTWSTHTILYLP